MTGDGLLRQGVSALKSGRKVEARKLFLEVIQQDGRNEMAWLWLSGAVDQVEDRRICLENVLSINPYNQAAKQGLVLLNDSAAEQMVRVPESSPGGSGDSPDQTAVGPGMKEEGGDPQPSELQDGTSTAGSKEAGGKAGAGWKWILLGAAGLVLVLLRVYWLVGALGSTRAPVLPSSTSPLVASSPLAPEQAYASDMAPALQKLVVWASGPLADWNGLMAETVPGTSGEGSRGLELSACIQMAKACAADAAMWDRMKESFLPIASKLGEGGDEVLSALNSANPPTSVAETHEQVVACVMYETDLAKSIQAFFDGSGILDVALKSDSCDHLSSEISTLSQFVQDAQ